MFEKFEPARNPKDNTLEQQEQKKLYETFVYKGRTFRLFEVDDQEFGVQEVYSGANQIEKPIDTFSGSTQEVYEQLQEFVDKEQADPQQKTFIEATKTKMRHRGFDYEILYLGEDKDGLFTYVLRNIPVEHMGTDGIRYEDVELNEQEPLSINQLKSEGEAVIEMFWENMDKKS